MMAMCGARAGIRILRLGGMVSGFGVPGKRSGGPLRCACACRSLAVAACGGDLVWGDGCVLFDRALNGWHWFVDWVLENFTQIQADARECTQMPLGCRHCPGAIVGFAFTAAALVYENALAFELRRATGLRLCLLLNFGRMRLDIMRVGNRLRRKPLGPPACIRVHLLESA